MNSTKAKLPSLSNRSEVLVQQRNLKMPRSAHAYVRGNTEKFYAWLDSNSGTAIPQAKLVCLPLTEPAWSLQVTLTPTPRFPFPDKAVIPIGRARLPGAGEFVPLALSARAHDAGFHAAWILGAGGFVVAASEAPVALTANAPSTSRDFIATIQPEGWRLECRSDSPRVIFISEPTMGVARLRDYADFSCG